MKLIDRYIVSRLAMWLAIILLSVASLYVMIDLTTRTRADIIEHGAPAKVVALYYLNYLPLILLQMAPVAYLIASLFVLGNFARNNEYTALLAGGVSLYRFAVAPIALSAVVAVCALALGEFVLPGAARRAEYLEKTYLESSKPARQISMAWSRPDLGQTYVIRRYNPIARSGEEVMITKRVGRTVVEKIEAERMFWDARRGKWVLERAAVVEVRSESETRRRVERMAAPIYETPEELDAGRRSADEKSFRELRRELTRLARNGLVYPEKWVDLHSKIALPITNFIIFFLAMPFALKVKRGGMAVSFGMSLAIGVVYMSLFEIGQALGRAQYLAPWVAAWGPNAVFLVVGFYLTMKTET
ncbi:MAG: LptF/LptG family permease [Candidatus Hydrogenedentes bacterium]|nr:LptF/LptG family permease [Candidatus Hydrogenedentota bacterium]